MEHQTHKYVLYSLVQTSLYIHVQLALSAAVAWLQGYIADQLIGLLSDGIEYSACPLTSNIEICTSKICLECGTGIIMDSISHI
jgi:hypothetical protein